MKKLILFIALITVSMFANAVSFKEATSHLQNNGGALVKETWIKYTCHGPITPKGIYPIVHGDVVSFHYPVQVGKSYPTIREIQAQNPIRFDKIARVCTVRRFAMTDLTGFNGQWLGWDTAHYDSKLKFSEVVITSNQCRALGSPCFQTAQCCGSSGRPVSNSPICNKDTNTCETKPALVEQQ